MPGTFLNPRESIHDNIEDDCDSSPETLENLIRVTQQEKSVLQTYYTDENGDIVTLSVYDISETDPTDILGISVSCLLCTAHEAKFFKKSWPKKKTREI